MQPLAIQEQLPTAATAFRSGIRRRTKPESGARLRARLLLATLPLSRLQGQMLAWSLSRYRHRCHRCLPPAGSGFSQAAPHKIEEKGAFGEGQAQAHQLQWKMCFASMPRGRVLRELSNRSTSD